jgi:hypothetical protein
MAWRRARFRLTAEEQAEVDRMIREPGRFHSDGREVLAACIAIPLFCVPLMAVLFGDARTELAQIRSREIQVGWGLLFTAPELFGFYGLLNLAAGFAVYGVRTLRRHGVVITTFGVVRVRGGSAGHGAVTDELEVTSQDGRVIRIYGYGVGRYRELIERRLNND